MSVSVQLNLSRLHRIAARIVPDVIEPGASDWADAVVDRAKELAAVDTGEMRDSIHKEREAAGVYRAVASAAHSIFVEMGTHKAAAQPFMTPASRQVRGLPFFVRALKALIR
jgi:HK97 gp10 family phage protein